jgi:hypothetical protein
MGVGGCGEARAEVGGGAHGSQLARADDRHAVTDALGGVEQMGGQEDRAALRGQCRHRLTHLARAARIEAVGGLVQDQYPGFVDEGGGQGQPLAHALRVSDGVCVRAEAETFRGRSGPMPGLPAPETVQSRHELQQFEPRQIG